MENKIEAYILERKVFTLATCNNNIPYCANCYYVYNNESKTLIFLSSDTTRHIAEALSNNKVAGTIDNDDTTVAKIKGLQFTGDFITPSAEEEKQLYKRYYHKFPFAKEIPSPIWTIKLNWVKMTDNTLGFGKKLKWER